jgi:hypothetical protein
MPSRFDDPSTAREALTWLTTSVTAETSNHRAAIRDPIANGTGTASRAAAAWSPPKALVLAEKTSKSRRNRPFRRAAGGACRRPCGARHRMTSPGRVRPNAMRPKKVLQSLQIQRRTFSRSCVENHSFSRRNRTRRVAFLRPVARCSRWHGVCLVTGTGHP